MCLACVSADSYMCNHVFMHVTMIFTTIKFCKKVGMSCKIGLELGRDCELLFLNFLSEDLYLKVFFYAK